MSAEQCEKTTAGGDASPAGSPRTQKDIFLLPNSPIPHKRNRTYSTNQRIEKPVYHGLVEDFCRQRGHGFIKPNEGGALLFVHVSDIEGEFVPKKGDEVTFQKLLIPPKNEKYMAVHVNITHLKPGVSHETWDSISQQKGEPGTPGS